jgi:hypothetical protein
MMLSFRQAWLHYVQVSDNDAAKQHAFADIMNLLELACAIDEDKLFVAKGGELHRDYLLHLLKLIEQSDDARKRMQQMFMTPKTFLHIADFLKHNRIEFTRFTIP